MVCRVEAALIGPNDCWRQHELQQNKKNTSYSVAIRAESSDKGAEALALLNLKSYYKSTINMKEAVSLPSDIASVRSLVFYGLCSISINAISVYRKTTIKRVGMTTSKSAGKQHVHKPRVTKWRANVLIK